MYHIGLDARALEAGFKAHLGRGTGRYAGELIKNLEQLSREGKTPDLAFRLVGSSQLSPTVCDRRVIDWLPFGKMTFESQVLFARRIAKTGVSMMHFFAHGDAPALSRVAQVVTVLDLIPLRFPHLYRANKANLRFKFARFLEYQAIKRSLGVLAISEATKQDVVNLLGVEPDRIFVTPLAVSENFAARDLSPGNWREEAAQKRRLLALPVENPILLYVGGIDPRKNVPFLLRVFAEVLRVWPHRNRPLLVLVGKHENDDQLPQLLKEAERLEITANLRRPGFVPDELLRSYYQCADAVVFPSLYEGFGLPVLEAMACGVPVVAGKNSSIPEVAGIDSAILCEDGNISEWVSAVSALLADPSKQLDLSRRGVRQARRYSWMNTACLTVEAYRCLLPKGSAKSTHVLPGAI